MAEYLARPLHESGRGIAEIGTAVALSLLLAFFNLPVMPNGGQLSLDMLPLLLLAASKGSFKAAAAGLIYGSLHALQEPVIFHPLQFFLDYPLAYASLAVAGLPAFKSRSWLAVIAAVSVRLFCHTLSGVIFIRLFLSADQMPASPWLWSVGYNCTFLVPSALVLCLLVPPLKKAMDIYGHSRK
ncbi:MAG: energy-coupled thiamine transporter ThiT [Candidatus Bruticola sp.]